MRKHSDMTSGEPLPLLLSFAIPLVIGNLFQAAYSIVDRVIVGQFVGSDAFSAVGSTYAPSNMFAAVCIGMSVGSGVVVAQYFGAGKKEDVARAITNATYITMAFAVVTAIIGILLARPFLALLNTPEELLNDAASYMRIYLGGLIAVAAYYAPFSIIRALGDSKTPLIFLSLCSVLNIFLDIIFVVPLKMGVQGAAIATIIAQAVSAVLCIVYAVKKMELVRLAFSYPQPDRELISKTIKVGLPAAVQFALMYLSTVVMQSVINGFGTVVIGAYAAVSQMELLVQEAFNGLGSGMMTFAGQNMGAGKPERVRNGFKAILKICTIASLILLACFWIFGKPIMGMFIADSDVNVTDITSIASMGIRISSLFFMACGMNRILLSLLNGAGDAKYAMINGATEIVSRIALIFLLTGIPLLSYWGIFLTTGFTWLITATVGFTRYRGGKWENKSLIS